MLLKVKKVVLIFFSYELITIDHGTSQFNDVIAYIVQECITNYIYPIIHFLGHGGKNSGIDIWNEDLKKNDIVDWKMLFYHLANINKACHNNLFFTTCACHGFDSFKKIFMYELNNIPFVGIVAIDPDEKFYVKDACIVFSTFYYHLLESLSIDKALEAVNALKPSLIGRPSYIAFSADWFIRVYKLVVNKLYSRDNIETQVEKLSLMGPKLTAEEKLVKVEEFMALVDSYKQEDYIKIRDRMFMFDDPKVEKDRFSFPDKI